jgi:hypothetical protein
MNMDRKKMGKWVRKILGECPSSSMGNWKTSMSLITIEKESLI